MGSYPGTSLLMLIFYGPSFDGSEGVNLKQRWRHSRVVPHCHPEVLEHPEHEE